MSDFYLGQQNSFNTSSEFGELRDNYIYNSLTKKYEDGFHEGIDYVSPINKQQVINNELSGVIFDKSSTVKGYGQKLIVKSDLGFLHNSLKNLTVYTLYGHLHNYSEEAVKIYVQPTKFIAAGTPIGNMGNTGGCMTRILKWNSGISPTFGSYRYITPEEALDSNFPGGVHLHLSFYVLDKKIIEKITQDLILDAKKLANTFYIYQWGKYWINPKFVFKFLDLYRS